ncbi:MAG TPA: aldolase/citrate lyase family protein [Thermoguttaceae bacterium]|nr:aldolase/citrate lyase family protein [Thermoguttaceae bacterium]
MKKMRRSRVLAQLRQGKVASCTKLNISDPRVAEIAAMSGVDCVWTCQEHVANTIIDVENQVRACKIYDVDMMVRVQRGSYSDLICPLEVDATGIMIPHVMSAADARQVARWTRFHPVGRRPLDGGNADGGYCQVPGPEYLREANRERFVIIQIEDPEPMEELEEIASVEGIDMLFFGPADYAHALGIPFQFDHPAISEARRRIVDAAGRNGKFAGTTASPETLQTLVDEGFRFLNISADVLILTEGFAKVAEAFRQAKLGKSKTSRASCDACGGDGPL